MAEEIRVKGDWITTFSGRQFWPCDPRPEDLDIQDIAHALSLLCRFTGHTFLFYSVAQHSTLCSRIVPASDAKWGLMHDASEAYLADVARPVKPYLDNYRELEDRLMQVIAQRFGLPWPMPQSVHRADDILVCTERRDLLHPGHDWGKWTKDVPLLPSRIMPLDGPAAEREFLERYEQLFGVRNPCLDT
jgi:hypothetical protein